MEITCVTCNRTLDHKAFTKQARRKPNPSCRECWYAANADRLAARHVGLRMCAVCKVARPVSDFSMSAPSQPSSYCHGCAAKKLREFKQEKHETATHFTCVLCNTDKPRDEFSFNTGKRKEKRCKECNARRTAMGRFADKTKFNQARGIAKRRDLCFELTMEQYLELRSKPCHYCGYPLPTTGVGLDRKDDNIGYCLTNVVPCCWPCNQARGTYLTTEEAKVLGEAMGRIKAARIANGIPLEPVSGWGAPRKYARDSHD